MNFITEYLVSKNKDRMPELVGDATEANMLMPFERPRADGIYIEDDYIPFFLNKCLINGKICHLPHDISKGDIVELIWKTPEECLGLRE